MGHRTQNPACPLTIANYIATLNTEDCSPLKAAQPGNNAQPARSLGDSALALTHEHRPRPKAQGRIPALWYPTHEYQHEQPSIVLAALPLSGMIASESNQRREQQRSRRLLTTEVISTIKFSDRTPTYQRSAKPWAGLGRPWANGVVVGTHECGHNLERQARYPRIYPRFG